MINELPKDLSDSLKEYLHDHEKVFDVIKEVYVFRFDFSWIVLTNERVIVATKRILEYNFKDYPISSLSIDINLGFFYDKLSFAIPGKLYSADFYKLRRVDTLRFFHEVEKNITRKEEGESLIKSGKEIKENGEKPCPPVETIKELKKLYDDGVITKEDYEKKKDDLLGKI